VQGQSCDEGDIERFLQPSHKATAWQATALGMTREGAKCWLDFAAVKSTLATMIRKDIVIAAVIGVLLTAGSARAQELNVEQIVAQKVQPILPKNGEGGGVAVAVHMGGKTSFFNYGMASNAQSRPVTADSIFNLGSVGKVFATTLLAQAVKQGEVSLDDSVAKYVTELQRGGDIRGITLAQLASHSSGLPRVPQQYETWHRGRYTWPDFVRFLNSWKAAPNHEPGQQYLYSNAAMVPVARCSRTPL
jgi:CubicO group peptidase (beta-lactamase class C family)